MTEQARPFKNVNKIDTLETPGVTRTRPVKTIAVQNKTATIEEVDGEERSVLDKLVASGWFSWERAIWFSIFALAVLMHLVDLGPRAMHHDESIHGRFSYDMFKGVNVYKYDPTWHGPLLYYMVSLSYFLFGGATETTARLAPAFYGIALVGVCFFLRPIIGRVGAVVMGIFMLFSPSMLYYGRSLRHDIFATMGELLFVVAFFRFIQNKPGHKRHWLAVAGLGLIIFYASHEMVFIVVGIIVAWLALVFMIEVVALPGWIRIRSKTETELPQKSPESGTRQAALENEHWDTAEQELTEQGITQANGPIGDPIFGSWLKMGGGIFALISLVVLLGSAYTFTNPVPEAFGLPQFVLTIPAGLLLALVTAYGLGGFLAYGYGRLEARNVRFGRIVILVSLVILGALATFSALKPKTPPAETDSTAVTAQAVTSSSSDIILLGMYQLPRLVFNLTLVIIASFLLGVIAAWLRQRRFLVFTSKGVYGAAVSFFAVMLVSSLVSLRFALADKALGVPKGGLFLVGPQVDKWVAYVFNGFLVAAGVGLLAGWLVSLADRIDDSELAGSAILRGALRVARQPMAVGGFILGFGVIYVLIFSNFFFNLAGLADGVYRGVEYWAEAHGKRRLDQPWFYYPMIMLIYEIVPVIFGFAALFTFPVIFLRKAIVRGRFRFTIRGLFIGLSLWWAFWATIAFSIAGEKAPWLNMQITVPTALAASAFLDFYLHRVPWRQFWGWNRGPIFALLFFLTFSSTLVVIGMLINLPQDTALQAPALLQAAIVEAIAAATFIGCYWLWRSKRVSGRVARAAVVLVFGIILYAYTIKSTIALNYLHPDTAVEPLIYVQTTPEIPLFMQRLDRLSRDLRDNYKTNPAPAGTTQLDPANSKGLPVLLINGDNGVAWPLEWYMREYTDKNYINPDAFKDSNASLVDSRGNNYVVICVSASENSNQVQQQLLSQYTPHTYKFRWWFPEDDSGYGGLGKDITHTDWSMIERSFTEQPYAGRLWRYLMYRELPNPLQSFDMVVYVRNDVDPNWGLNEGGTAAGGQAAYGLFESSQPGVRNGQFHTPRDIEIAPNGDILVLDSENARIQRFDKDGKFLSKFGSSGKDDGKFGLAQLFSGPSGMAVDQDGNIYVADSWNFRIQKFDKDGKFLLKWGEGKDTKGDPEVNRQSPTGLYGPRQLAYDNTHQELYVTDTGNKRVVVYDRNGVYLRQFGSYGSGPGQFNEPVGIALSQDGSKVYVSDIHNKRIQVLNRNGQSLSEIKVTWNDLQPLVEPYLALDAAGNLFASDSAGAKILKFDQSGNLVNTYDAAKGVNLINPVGLAFDTQGNLLVADAKRNSIVKITP